MQIGILQIRLAGRLIQEGIRLHLIFTGDAVEILQYHLPILLRILEYIAGQGNSYGEILLIQLRQPFRLDNAFFLFRTACRFSAHDIPVLSLRIVRPFRRGIRTVLFAVLFCPGILLLFVFFHVHGRLCPSRALPASAHTDCRCQ